MFYCFVTTWFLHSAKLGEDIPIVFSSLERFQYFTGLVSRNFSKFPQVYEILVIMFVLVRVRITTVSELLPVLLAPWIFIIRVRITTH